MRCSPSRSPPRRLSLRATLTAAFVAAVGLALPPAGLLPVPLLHVPQFLFGVALGLRFATRPSPHGNGRGTLMAATSATLLALVLAQSPRVSPSLLQNGVLAPLFGAAIYGLAQGGGLATLLSRPALVALGEASYAVYIFQVPVHHWLARVAPFDANRSVHVAGYIALLVAVSLLVHRYVERPGRRLVLALAARVFTARLPAPTSQPGLQAPAAVRLAVPPPSEAGVTRSSDRPS